MEIRLQKNLIKEAVGTKTGLASALHTILRDKNDPKLYNVSANNAALERLFNLKKEVSLRAGSMSPNKEEAMNKAVGELVERYCWVTYSPRIIFGNYNNLKVKLNMPFSKIQNQLFTKDQYKTEGFPFKPFYEDTNISWICGRDQFGKEIYLPAQFIIGRNIRTNEEQKITFSTTSGCAAAHSKELAILKGLYEQIERDAFMQVWYKKISPKRILIDNKKVKEFIEKFIPQNGLKYYLFDMTSDIGVPVFLSVCVDLYTTKTKFVCGAAASLNPEEAAIKAIMEASQGRMPAKRMALEKKTIPKSIDNLEDNVRFYLDGRNFKYLKFLFANKKTIKLSSYKNKSKDVKADIKHIVRTLNKKKFTAVFLDFTQEALNNIGLNVIKCFVLELAQLSLPSYPTLANARITPVRNLMPHPFP